VNVVQVFISLTVLLLLLCLCCNCEFSFLDSVCGKLLVGAMYGAMVHSLCFLSGVSGSECVCVT